MAHFGIQPSGTHLFVVPTHTHTRTHAHTHTHTHTDSLGEVAVNGVDTPTQPPQEFPSATEPVEVRQDEETFPSAEVPEQDNKGSFFTVYLITVL